MVHHTQGAPHIVGHMRALVVANSNDADPGFVGERFRHHGYAFSEAHREYPAEWPEMPGHDLILLLGSEWSVYWDHISGEVAAESALVKAAHQAGIPIFGICFGSQIVAHSLGGRVHRATRPDIRHSVSSRGHRIDVGSLDRGRGCRRTRPPRSDSRTGHGRDPGQRWCESQKQRPNRRLVRRICRLGDSLTLSGVTELPAICRERS